MAHEFTKFCSSFIALVAFTILIQVNAKELTDEQKEQLFTEVKNCVTETKLTDDEFETIIAKKELPTSKEGKCFTKCMMEKMEYLEEGKINVMAMQAALEENMDKEDKIREAKGFIQLCADNTATQEDSCEYAFRISECIYNKMKEVCWDSTQLNKKPSTQTNIYSKSRNLQTFLIRISESLILINRLFSVLGDTDGRYIEL